MAGVGNLSGDRHLATGYMSVYERRFTYVSSSLRGGKIWKLCKSCDEACKRGPDPIGKYSTLMLFSFAHLFYFPSSFSFLLADPTPFVRYATAFRISFLSRSIPGTFIWMNVSGLLFVRGRYFRIYFFFFSGDHLFSVIPL